VRAGPRQGNSRGNLCGRSSDRRPISDRDSPRRKTEMRYPTRASELVDRRLQIPPSPLHDPSVTQLHARPRGDGITARFMLDLGHQRFPGSPSCAFAPVRDPGRTDGPLPMTVPPVLPLLHRRQRLRRDVYIEATAGLKHLLPTLREWCCHHPRKARFRLAGSPLPGGSWTLWTAMKGFRALHLFLLSWIYPDATV